MLSVLVIQLLQHEGTVLRNLIAVSLKNKVQKIMHMCPNFGKPRLSLKLFRVVRRFRSVTEILSIIFSYVDNHEDQSLSFHLVPI